jgi:hypothetical protein
VVVLGITGYFLLKDEKEEGAQNFWNEDETKMIEQHYKDGKRQRRF